MKKQKHQISIVQDKDNYPFYRIYYRGKVFEGEDPIEILWKYKGKLGKKRNDIFIERMFAFGLFNIVK